jgi:hypothetical protein
MASEKWNETPFILEKGKTYRFVANGRWTDLNNECDATGYDSKSLLLRLAEPLRRVRRAKWFSLIGALDRDEATCFDIGLIISSGGTYTAERNGKLFCFANDVSFMYGNNHGQVELEMVQDQQ